MLSSINLSNVTSVGGYTAAGIIAVCGIVALPLVPVGVAYLLANAGPNVDLGFKTVEEGTARAVMRNDQFDKMIMSWEGRRFRGKVIGGDPDSVWDVIKTTEEELKWYKKVPILRSYIGLAEGIYWIGVPPLAKIDRFRFTWISWDHPLEKGADGVTVKNTGVKKQAIPHTNEKQDYILLQPDVYYLSVSEAETRTKIKLSEAELASVSKPGTKTSEVFDISIPLDIEILLTISICNPYKARFRVQHWLETVTNSLDARIREFIGTHEVHELITGDTATGDQLTSTLAKDIRSFKKKYGVVIEKIQIQSVKVAGRLAELYEEKTTAVYGAQQDAKATRIWADAEKDKLEKTVGYIGADKRRVKAYQWQQMPATKITTLVNSGGGSGGSASPIGITLPPTTTPATPAPEKKKTSGTAPAKDPTEPSTKPT